MQRKFRWIDLALLPFGMCVLFLLLLGKLFGLTYKQISVILKKKNWLFTYIGANQDALAVARDMGIDHSMNFMSDAKGTKAMFMKEQRSRKAFYDKLARGMSFKKAMAEEDYFMDDNEDA